MTRLTVGEPAPLFVAPTSSRPDYDFGTVAGRFIVLVFIPSSSSEAGQALGAALAADRALFDDDRCAFFGVSGDAEDQAQSRLKDDAPGVRWFYDPDGVIAGLYGVAEPGRDASPMWFLLDPMLRVLALGPLDVPRAMIDEVRRLPPLDAHAGGEVTAPVLIVPRVFEPGLCSALIDHYRQQGGEASGFMVQRDGRTVLAFDPSQKRRADCIIQDEQLRTDCRVRIQRRLVPEIAKAFQFQATRMERYLVACYSGEDRGRFAAHRDNTTKGTAHRRFAVTLNLNAGDYDGGELRFPEFGPRLYKPPTGGAVVFSCSLLHEALPVTRGLRYAFLPFLYDEAAAELRERNNPHLDPNIGEYRR